MVATNVELLGETLTDIADAIREKSGTFGEIALLDMADEIRKLQGDQDEYTMIRVPNMNELNVSSQTEMSTENVVSIAPLESSESFTIQEPTLSMYVEEN